MRLPVKLAVLAVAMFLLSCGARRVADVLDVEVAPHFAGAVQIKACRPGHPNTLTISVDDHGIGETGECSFSDQVRIRLHRAGTVVEIPRQNVNLVKTGDGLVTEITFQVVENTGVTNF